eukprot:g43625.t1
MSRPSSSSTGGELAKLALQDSTRQECLYASSNRELHGKEITFHAGPFKRETFSRTPQKNKNVNAAMSLLWNLGLTVASVGYAIITDLIAVPTRPLALASTILPWTALQAFRQPGFLLAIFSSFAVGLITISLRQLFANKQNFLLLLMLPWWLDAFFQTTNIVGMGPFDYPTSDTVFWNLFLQLPVSTAGLLEAFQVRLSPQLRAKFKEKCLPRIICLATSLVQYHSSRKLLQGPVALLISRAAWFWLFLAFLPMSPKDLTKRLTSIARLCQAYLEILCKYLEGLCKFLQHGWQSLQQLLPALADLFLSIRHGWERCKQLCWELTLWGPVAWAQRFLIAPVWQVLSPLLLPSVAMALAILTGQRFLVAVGSWHFLSWLVLAQLWCTCAAFLSSLILLVHAGNRIFQKQINPLDMAVVSRCLSTAARALCSPWHLSKRGLRLVPLLAKPLLTALEKWVKWTHDTPGPALVTNVFVFTYLLYFFYSSALGLSLWAACAGCWRKLSRSMSALQQEPLENAADSGLVVLLVSAFQVGGYAFVTSLLKMLAKMRAARLASQNVNIDTETASQLAASLRDPRQCARCFYGPVAHFGCSNLRLHHGETRGGSQVSNACPCCGWFATSLADWPPWDARGLGVPMFSQRIWGEVVVVVRATCKSLVLPFLLLRLGGFLNLWPSLVAVLAILYLLLWGYENALLYEEMYKPEAFQRRLARRQQSRSRLFHARRLTRQHRERPSQSLEQKTNAVARTDHTDNTARTVTTGRMQEDVVDCGAATRSQEEAALPLAVPSVALANMLSATPARVFLAAGDSCAVCLEEFTEEHASVAQALDGPQAALALQKLRPAAIALRCGHPLHVECAEQAVVAASNRHVRCPLCREPVSFTGATQARWFS